MTIAVTGATGQLSRRALTHLARRLPSGTNLVALTRDPSLIDERNEWGAEVRRGDFNEISNMTKALNGVAALLLVSVEAPDDERVRLHENAVGAARNAGVKRIIYTSFFDIDPASPSMVARVHRETEQSIQASGCEWIMLRNGPYIDNFARRAADAARGDGVLRLAAGDARLPFIGRDDLAEAAACSVLRGTPNTAYRLSGPELLSCADVAQLVSQVLGKPLRYQAVDDAAQTTDLRRQGLSLPLIERRNAYTRALREGFMTALTGDFQALVGREARRVSELIETLDLSPATH